MNDTTITSDIAAKVLRTVDAGLSAGLGEPVPGQMCVEAAVNYALGREHGDDPGCVDDTLRRLKIVLNDARWSSPEARSRGLRRLALAQLGSKDALDAIAFVARCAELSKKYAAASAEYAAESAEYAAESAKYAASYDKVLADYCEDVVQILIDMKAPGCAWLYLTEESK